MVEWKKKSRRKKTGGINNSLRRKTKSLSDRGGLFTKTTVDENDFRFKVRTTGGNSKLKISKAENVLVSQGNTTKKAKILDVISNPANKHFVRQKVITKGAILEVDLDGKKQKVKVTSRPGQSGLINTVIVK
jgi:ribosomal protein eS8